MFEDRYFSCHIARWVELATMASTLRRMETERAAAVMAQRTRGSRRSPMPPVRAVVRGRR